MAVKGRMTADGQGGHGGLRCLRRVGLGLRLRLGGGLLLGWVSALALPAARLGAQPASAPFDWSSETQTAVVLQQWVDTDPNLDKEIKRQMHEFAAAYALYAPKMSLETASSVDRICSLARTASLKFYPETYTFLKAQWYIDTALYAWGADWLASVEQSLQSHKIRDFSRLTDRTWALLADGQFAASTRATWEVVAGRPVWDPEAGTLGGFRFEGATLRCTAYNDSSVIHGAVGWYDPLAQTFTGEDGRVSWRRIGPSGEPIQAEIYAYRLNLNSNRYESDSAVFYNAALCPDPVQGRFVEKLSVLTSAEAATYPQFYSRVDRLRWSGFFPGLDLEGPYVQQGSRMVFGSDDVPVRLIVYDEADRDRVLGVVEAARVLYQDEKLQSPMVSWRIYLGANDSMYHHTSEMRYDIPKRQFLFTHSKRFSLEMPALSTYHQISLSYENMQWFPQQARVTLGILPVPEREGLVRMVSAQVYQERDLETIMQGIPYNPLYRLKQYADRSGRTVISLEDLASAWGMDQTTLSQWMLQLASLGFLSYHAKEKEIVLLPKLHLYLAVSAEKSDFDHLEILASGKAWVKAELRTDSLDIRLREVEEVVLSPKQRVYFRPDQGELSVGWNRSLYFDGLLHAGTFDFDVRDARFSYEDFKVEIGLVDTLLFSVPGEVDEYGQRQEVKVNTLIHNLSGLLHIDTNINKGGRLDFPEYPIFESTIPSYVYYDDETIQGGVYSADSFYFEVDPFKMTRLNTFSSDSIHFAGTMVSAGIFPDFRESLVVMPDYSLGFKTATPAEGWPVYGGLGRFTDSLYLDRHGLVGQGQFDFLASRTRTPEVHFRPADMDMQVRHFEQDMALYPVNNGRTYPKLAADSIQGYFDAATAAFQLTTKPGHSLYPYYEPWRFEGAYTFSDKRSVADGEMLFGGDARIKAEDWHWAGHRFVADEADFQLGGGKNGKYAYLLAEDVEVEADVEHKSLLVRAAGSGAAAMNAIEEAQSAAGTDGSGAGDGILDASATIEVRMPLQAYTAEVYGLHWSWEDERLWMNQSASPADSVGLPLYATGKTQVGLQFEALRSTFRYKDTLLICDGVSGLAVADAWFAPDSNRLTILPNGHIEPLANAVLSFPADEPAYEFRQVGAEIQSAGQYEADGWYAYEAPGLDPQAIHFDRIRVRKSDSTSEAVANLDEEYLFLDEGFEFLGQVTASAQAAMVRESQDLYFSGMAGLRYRIMDDASGDAAGAESGEAAGDSPAGEGGSDGNEEDWYATAFRFQAYMDPAQIRIPVSDQTRSGRGRSIRAGFFSASDGRPHFVFMEPVLSTEHPIAAAEGYLCYEPEDKAYLIVDDQDNELLAYELKTGESSVTGPLQLNLRTGAMQTAFYGQLFQEGGGAADWFMQTVFQMDFYFAAPLFKRIADELNKNTALMAGRLADNPMFDVFMQETLSKPAAEELRKELQSYGSVNHIPAAWQKGLVFSSLSFEWEPSVSAYRSTGTGELLMVGPHWVNKKMKVYAQINRGRRGDVMHLYLEASRYNWYYFNYADNTLQVISSDQGFNEMIDKLKASKRRKGRYEFMLSTMRKKDIFVASFEAYGAEAEEEEWTEDGPEGEDGEWPEEGEDGVEVQGEDGEWPEEESEWAEDDEGEWTEDGVPYEDEEASE